MLKTFYFPNQTESMSQKSLKSKKLAHLGWRSNTLVQQPDKSPPLRPPTTEGVIYAQR